MEECQLHPARPGAWQPNIGKAGPGAAYHIFPGSQNAGVAFPAFQKKEIIMDANAYFDSMYFELNFLKTKVGDIIHAVESNPRAAKLIPQLPRLQYLEGHLSKRIAQLWRECPAEWGAASRDMEMQQKVA